jgi:phosphate/sulfate permease
LLGTLGGWIAGVFISMHTGGMPFPPFQTGLVGGLIGAGVALSMAHRRMKGLDCALKVLSGVCLVAPVLACFFACLLPVGSSKSFERAAFDRVIAEIQRGALRPDHQGVVQLPRELASLSATRRVYVRRWPSGRLIVFFPSWVGRGTALINVADVSGDNWLEGYIYDSLPQSRKHSGTKVTEDDYPNVLGPPRGPPWKAAHSARAELRPDLVYRQQVTEHWSYANIFS